MQVSDWSNIFVIYITNYDMSIFAQFMTNEFLSIFAQFLINEFLWTSSKRRLARHCGCNGGLVIYDVSLKLCLVLINQSCQVSKYSTFNTTFNKTELKTFSFPSIKLRIEACLAECFCLFCIYESSNICRGNDTRAIFCKNDSILLIQFQDTIN